MCVAFLCLEETDERLTYDPAEVSEGLLIWRAGP